MGHSAATARNTGPPVLFSIRSLGSFTCVTQYMGPTALRLIRRTKQWLSVLLRTHNIFRKNIIFLQDSLPTYKCIIWLLSFTIRLGHESSLLFCFISVYLNVPSNRTGSCGIMLILLLREVRGTDLISTPSIMMRPETFNKKLLSIFLLMVYSFK